MLNTGTVFVLELVMVWCCKSLPVRCSSFYCRTMEVSEVLHCVMAWEEQQELAFGDFLLTGEPGRTWNGFNSTLISLYCLGLFLPAKSGI